MLIFIYQYSLGCGVLMSINVDANAYNVISYLSLFGRDGPYMERNENTNEDE